VLRLPITKPRVKQEFVLHQNNCHLLDAAHAIDNVHEQKAVVPSKADFVRFFVV